MRSKLLILLMVALSAILLTPISASAQSDAVAVNFDGLEPLGPSLVYEGWLIIDGEPLSSGTFNIDSNGNVVVINEVDVPNAAASTDYVLTIEPASDPDPAPAPTHILGGAFNSNGVASLTIDHPAAFGFNFDNASGSYILKTPTTETTDDDRSGIWFLDPAGPGPSLDLPTLPDGWIYEGWAVIDGNPVSTGRFLSASGADDFDGFSGPLAGPPFPGEDLIENAPAGLSFPTDLTGATIAISVEPSPDDSPAPFALKPLIDQVSASDAVGSSIELEQGPTAITGVATLAASQAPTELALTGIDSWLLAGGAIVLLGLGAAFVVTSRRFALSER